MRHATRRSGRRGALLAAAAVLLVVVAAACTASSATPPPAGVDPRTGFPTGTFVREFTDPSVGRVRIMWVFDRDGRWAEVPDTVNDEARQIPPARGTYTVDGDTFRIATDYPPGWGTSQHRWRLDGELLWTRYLSSDNPDDEGWFGLQDHLPWTRVP